MSHTKIFMLLAVAMLCGLIITPIVHAQGQGCRYEGDFSLKPVWNDPVLGKSGEHDVGDYEMQLRGDLSYVDCEGNTHKIDSGTVVNGASIPQLAWSILGYTPWSGKTMNAAIVHDSMCERAVFTSERVHNLFHEGLIVSKVPDIEASIMYAAVAYFGPQWSVTGGPKIYPSYSDVAMRLIVQLIATGSRLAFGQLFTEDATPPKIVAIEQRGEELKSRYTESTRYIDQLLEDIRKVPEDRMDDLLERRIIQMY